MNDNTLKLKFGRDDLILETGKVAKQANGSVTIVYGGTVVLVTACMSREAREGRDFFPLTVEYQEKTYAAGRIPGGFFKREGRPSESEILAARLVDRSIRPLFPKGLFNDVQVMAIVLSSDGKNDPDVLAVNGASAALGISDIPFSGPLAACRVARVNNELLINPTYAELDSADLEVILAANNKGIMMLESRAKKVSEGEYLEAVKFGYGHLKDLIHMQEEFVKKCGKPKTTVELEKIDPALEAKVNELSRERLEEVYKLGKKEEREEAVYLLAKELEEKLTVEGYSSGQIKMALDDVEQEQVRNKIITENIRIDGRGFKDIRPISCEVSVLPRTHGSSLFTRGQTQSLAVTTLGTGEDEQMVEALEGEKFKTFMLHYSFPPFSVGETGPVRGPGRREIGHGALAEKALLAVMPSKEEFPYTVRVVSEILESNGSSSMATVCAAALSLMDAGVPIKDTVAGIALGLIKEGDKALILTDIAGLEDHFGDMDFKVAGTRQGITAVQMDLKIDGIGIDLLDKCLSEALDARMIILDKMNAALSKPREELSDYAPRIDVIKINTEKIGELIGPGGKNVKAIIAATGASVDIKDDGTVLVGSTDALKSEMAIKMIKAITDDVEVGRIYIGKVKRIMPFGAFCEIAPRKEGLVHVSELSGKFVKNVDEVVKIGDNIKVKVIGIDELGRINLSKKQAEEPVK
ncbi:MAG: polyribonucleotide nucleotidyltransferase [Candidatus Omnitrophica bacterium CG08_land_8_20_14_0_20_41_16]|uniref:Polyribonucleotide nucleotidyltransferase n=1 Tax=Candidatus Sherwoodlollariibacterium unditelluris TaxID=1974757 RepID=A0A2G9YHH9_9BACT|nr:MAG: polyribonucleotide nucleotidyltransferase [Candidatus Omnitrophica bacterium CG23_combo_of_CG06-09_8_20_14_all_41_10]PIS34224.1 MAG: polyribonucleotide nucleotidyltransferase [Candidatus Omnitrophica bacterium CG08_land_8_20_14_0_20_41_16]